METLPKEPKVVPQGRDFPWAPIAEALEEVFGCFAIVCGMSVCGWWVGDWIALAWLKTGIGHDSFLALWPGLHFFTPEFFLAILVSVVTLHQSLCFTTTRELFKAGTVAFVVWSVASCLTVIRLGDGPPPDLRILRGEWVREDLKGLYTLRQRKSPKWVQEAVK